MESKLWWIAGTIVALLIPVILFLLNRLSSPRTADQSIHGVNFSRHKGKEMEKR